MVRERGGRGLSASFGTAVERRENVLEVRVTVMRVNGVYFGRMRMCGLEGVMLGEAERASWEKLPG